MVVVWGGLLINENYFRYNQFECERIRARAWGALVFL